MIGYDDTMQMPQDVATGKREQLWGFGLMGMQLWGFDPRGGFLCNRFPMSTA